MGNKTSSPIPREFSLAKRGLKLESAADVREFCQAIKEAKNLDYVNLSGNSFSTEAARAIAEAIGQARCLRHVNLSDCFTGRLKEDVPPALTAFGKALSLLPALQSVDFSDNALGPSGAQALSAFLSVCVSVEEIKLNNLGLGPDGGRTIAESLLKLAQTKSANLKLLSMGRNRLENGSAEAFAKCFEALAGTIEQVFMHQNGIRPEGISTLISNGLIKCTKLKHLDLQDNTFTLKGSEALAAALPKWTNLKHLNVGDCLLGNVGSLKVIQAMNDPLLSSLTHLNLQYNEIDEIAAQSLTNKLAGMRSLEQLLLNGNCFSAKGRVGTAILTILAQTGKSQIIDAWDDMEVSDDEDNEEEDDEEQEREEEEDRGKVEEEKTDETSKDGQLEEDIEKLEKLNI